MAPCPDSSLWVDNRLGRHHLNGGTPAGEYSNLSLLIHSHAQQAALGVSPADDNGRAVGQSRLSGASRSHCPDGRSSDDYLGVDLLWQIEHGQELARPGSLTDVQQSGVCGTGQVGNCPATESADNPVVHREDCGYLIVHIRMVTLEPSQLGRGEERPGLWMASLMI